MIIAPRILRRRDFFALAAGLLVANTTRTNAADGMVVYKTSGCACCLGWIKHLRQAGFAIEAKNLDMGTLMKMKLDGGLTAKLAACHTAKIADYLVEGHVPAREIRRLLAERPDAIGLAVPGMPVGSPGMESGTTREAYDVLLVRKDGGTEIFATYEPRK